MQDKIAFFGVWILVKMIDTLGVELRCTTFDTVNLVPFFDQQLGEVRTILTSDPGNQCFLFQFILKFI